MSPGLAMKQRVSGQCWMNVWLGDGEPGSSFKSRALHSWSRLLVLEWLCTRVWLWCCMWTHASLIRLQGADNKPSKSSKWDHKCLCTLDIKTKTGLAADIGLLCSLCFLFPLFPFPSSLPPYPPKGSPLFFCFYLLYLVWLFFSCFSSQKNFRKVSLCICTRWMFDAMKSFPYHQN